MKKITVQVPATTANLGPGYDTLGVALQLYNQVTIEPSSSPWSDLFFETAATLFFKSTQINPETFSVTVSGDVPRSRGLGSSVTVRLGILQALNIYYDSPLKPEKLLSLVVELEGHPDNAIPAFHGGFAACAAHTHFTVPVDEKLKFIIVVPDYEVQTEEARSVIPYRINLNHAIINIQNTAQIVAAFCTKDYSRLKSCFADCLHQPYRFKLIPGGQDAVKAARNNNALGTFISGSGSSIAALALENEEPIKNAMIEAFQKKGQKNVKAFVLSADNKGVCEISDSSD